MWWEEKRRDARTKHDSVLELYDANDVRIAARARLVDVSARGIRFAGNLSLPLGSRIHGRMRLLHAGVLDVIGLVVRVNPGTNVTHYGVAFDSVKALVAR